jgi:hypothetical protein
VHKDDQLDDILEKRKILVKVILETKRKLQGSKESKNFFQLYSFVKKEIRAKAGIMIMIHKRLKSAIDNYTFWNERIIQL